MDLVSVQSQATNSPKGCVLHRLVELGADGNKLLRGGLYQSMCETTMTPKLAMLTKLWPLMITLAAGRRRI